MKGSRKSPGERACLGEKAVYLDKESYWVLLRIMIYQMCRPRAQALTGGTSRLRTSLTMNRGLVVDRDLERFLCAFGEEATFL